MSSMISSKPLRVAFIGAGAIVKYAHIPNFRAIPGCELAAICDVAEARAQALATEFSIPGLYTDYKAMLAEVKPDITVVASPNVFHKEQAIAALESGSHVLCEKPLAPTYADAVELFETAKRLGKVLTPGTHYRFAANMRICKQQSKAGFFGKIYAVRTTWNRRSGIPGIGGWFTNRDLATGGVLLDLGVHALDRALYLMDYPRPVAVSGAMFAEFGPLGRGAGGWGMDAQGPRPAGALRFDVDDMSWAMVRFENGAVLHFQVAWASNFNNNFTLEIYGTEGGALVNENDQVELYTSLNGQEATVQVPLSSAAGLSSYGALAQNLVRRVNGDTEAEIVTPEQALVAVEIVDAIMRSAQSGREVLL